MEENNRPSTKIMGIAASQNLDSSGERIDIKGLSIESLGGPESTFTWEHLDTGKHPSLVVGKVTFGKKIMKRSECDNDDERKYWDHCKCPYIFIRGELFDDSTVNHEGAKEVAALLRYDNKDKGKKSKRIINFSIDGGTMQKKGMDILKSIARDVSLVQKSCNKVCIVDIVPEEDDKSLYKKESLTLSALTKNTSRDVILDSLSKSEPVLKSEPKSATFNPAIAPLKKPRKSVKKVAKPRKPALKPYSTDNNMRKSLIAGSSNASPSSLTGMPALSPENLMGSKQDVTIKGKKRKKKIKKSEQSIPGNKPAQAISQAPQQARQPTVEHNQVHSKDFHKALSNASTVSENIKNNVHIYHPDEYKQHKNYLSKDGKSGYSVKKDGELISVFSSEKGRGKHIMGSALKNGASHLDAFDGHLPKFYKQHGFKEYKREKNYTAGGPDVVYMKLGNKNKLGKSEKLIKGQPTMSFDKITDKPNKPEQNIQTNVSEDFSGKKVQNKHLQARKQHAGVSNMNEFDNKSQKILHNEKKMYGTPSGSQGINMSSTDNRFKVNEGFVFDNESQSKEELNNTKGRGNFPSTVHHEGLHNHLANVAQSTNEDHSQSLVRHMLDKHFDPKDRKDISSYIKSQGYEGDINEESLTHILDMLTSSKNRDNFHRHSDLGKEGNRSRMSRLKSGWKNAVKDASGIDKKQLNKIHQGYEVKDKQVSSGNVKVQRFKPGESGVKR